MIRRFLSLLGPFVVFLCLCGESTPARASGFYYPGRGVHSMSRGGASIAGGETLQAIWYNPATLTQLSGWHFLLDAGTVLTQAQYTRAPRKGENGQNITYDPVTNEAPLVPIPSLLLGYGWKDAHVTLAGGLYAPYATPLKFPDTGAQRYALVDLSRSVLAVAHLAVSWEPHPRFRIGAGIQNFIADMNLMAAGSAYLGLFGAPEDPDLDLYSEIGLQSFFNITGNLGVWGRAVDLPGFKLDIAASLQLPVQLQATGTLRVRLPTHPAFDAVKIEGESVKSAFWFPLVARGAVRATFGSRFDLEVAFVFENWESHKEIAVLPTGDGIWLRNVPAVGDYKVPSIVLTRDFQNSFSVRVGGQAQLLPWLQLRLGYAFETTAIPDKTFTVFLLDSNKHLIALGLSFIFRYVTVDLGYGLYLNQDRTIQNSEFQQINPLNPEGALPIGNGSYQSTVHVIGLGARAQF